VFGSQWVALRNGALGIGVEREVRHIGIAMSRQDELFRLADLFYLQANLTRDRAGKQSLRKKGDCYQQEAEQLRPDKQSLLIIVDSLRPRPRVSR
jgi:hypothetical protein